MKASAHLAYPAPPGCTRLADDRHSRSSRSSSPYPCFWPASPRVSCAGDGRADISPARTSAPNWGFLRLLRRGPEAKRHGHNCSDDSCSHLQFTFRPAIITVSMDRVLRMSSSGFLDKTIRSAHFPFSSVPGPSRSEKLGRVPRRDLDDLRRSQSGFGHQLHLDVLKVSGKAAGRAGIRAEPDFHTGIENALQVLLSPHPGQSENRGSAGTAFCPGVFNV